VDEGRKRVLLIAASILAARNLARLDSDRPSPAFEAAIGNAIHTAERIMRKIDAQWPSRQESGFPKRSEERERRA